MTTPSEDARHALEHGYHRPGAAAPIAAGEIAAIACVRDRHDMGMKAAKDLVWSITRPAPTPVDRIRAGDLYACFVRGWTTGAKAGPLDPRNEGHADDGLRGAYLEGVAEGRAARAYATSKAARRYGYTPSILREESDR